MVAFTSLKLPAAQVPQRVGVPTCVFYTVDPSKFASFPGIADTVEFFDLPIGARVLDASLRIPASVGAATSTMKLQAKNSLATTDLCAALAMTAAGSAIMNVATPPADTTAVTTIQGLMAAAALNAAGTIEAYAEYHMAP